jgi:hypothetical protein
MQNRMESLCTGMRSCAALAVLSLCSGVALAQEKLWIHQFAPAGGAWALAPRDAGGIFVAGSTTINLGGPNAGGHDAYLAAYTSTGVRSWIIQFGTEQDDGAYALADDGAGGVYIAGGTGGSLGGPHLGQSDAWLARYHSTGTRLWIRQFGTPAWDSASALAADGSGGVYIAGRTRGSLGGPNSGGPDVYLARYNASGQQLWVRQFGSGLPGGENIAGLAADGAGGVFIGGFTDASLGAPASGYTDLWLARYDSDGNRLWLVQYDSGIIGVGIFPWGIAPDSAGGVFLGGYTDSFSSAMAFVARYNSAGASVWFRHYDNVPNPHRMLYGLAPDGAGGVLVTGALEGGSHHVPQPPYDAFVAHHDASGERTWLRDFGSSGRESGWAVTSDSADGAYVLGTTTGDLGGSGGAFLARFGYAVFPCYANCDGSTTPPILNVEDFTCFINEFAAATALPPSQQQTHYANCDNSTTQPVLNVEDFTCFINKFAQGCP